MYRKGAMVNEMPAATQVILKSLDWLEILENGYNLKEMIFSAPKWVSQVSQISLGGPFIQGGFFNWSGLKMTKSQPLKEFSELVLPKKRLRMKKV